MKKRIEYDAPATSRNTRAWVIGTADTNRSQKWLDIEIRVIFQMGEYEAQKEWIDTLFEAFEADPSGLLKMPKKIVRRTFKNIEAAAARLLAVPLEEGQNRVWSAEADKYAKMGLDELQSYCDSWLTNQIRRYYDMQIFGAVWLQNQNPTYGDFGPYEIHPNAVQVPNTLAIADVRMSHHPWGGGKASQW